MKGLPPAVVEALRKPLHIRVSLTSLMMAEEVNTYFVSCVVHNVISVNDVLARRVEWCRVDAMYNSLGFALLLVARI